MIRRSRARRWAVILSTCKLSFAEFASRASTHTAMESAPKERRRLLAIVTCDGTAANRPRSGEGAGLVTSLWKRARWGQELGHCGAEATHLGDVAERGGSTGDASDADIPTISDWYYTTRSMHRAALMCKFNADETQCILKERLVRLNLLGGTPQLDIRLRLPKLAFRRIPRSRGRAREARARETLFSTRPSLRPRRARCSDNALP